MSRYLLIDLPEGSRIVRPKKGQTSILVELPASGVAKQRALWVKSYVTPDVEEINDTLPKDGKGFLLGLTGKLTVG